LIPKKYKLVYLFFRVFYKYYLYANIRKNLPDLFLSMFQLQKQFHRNHKNTPK